MCKCYRDDHRKVLVLYRRLCGIVGGESKDCLYTICIIIIIIAIVSLTGMLIMKLVTSDFGQLLQIFTIEIY